MKKQAVSILMSTALLLGCQKEHDISPTSPNINNSTLNSTYPYPCNAFTSNYSNELAISYQDQYDNLEGECTMYPSGSRAIKIAWGTGSIVRLGTYMTTNVNVEAIHQSTGQIYNLGTYADAHWWYSSYNTIYVVENLYLAYSIGEREYLPLPYGLYTIKVTANGGSLKVGHQESVLFGTISVINPDNSCIVCQ